MKRKCLSLLSVLLLVGFFLGTAPQPAFAQVEIPTGSTINSATFSIYVTEDSVQNVYLHRVTSDWDETTVTWNNFGGYDSTIIGSFVPDAFDWRSVDVTALVQAWVDGNYDNFGLLLKQTSYTPYSTFHSSEYDIVDLRPKLVVQYTPPGGSLTEVTIQRPGVEQDGVSDAFISELDPTETHNFDFLVVSLVNGIRKQGLIRFDFDVVPPPCITVHKFNDENGNGEQDRGEEDIVGWLIRLYDDSGNFIADARTDIDGMVTFCDLLPGCYKVWEEKRCCWEPTTPAVTYWRRGYFTVACTGTDTIVPVLVDFGNRYVCGGPGTGTPGYWKRHPDAWPVDEIRVGCITYTKEEAISIMNTAPRGDKTYNVFNHLISAKLNILIGNSSICIRVSVWLADWWMCRHEVGTNVRARTRAWRRIRRIFNRLVRYNEGDLWCADHRDN